MKKSTKKKYPWKVEYVFSIYDMLKENMKKSHIAETLGVPISALERWMEKEEVLQIAVEQATEKSEQASNYLEFVYKRLPDELVPTWEQIMNSYDEEDDVYRATAILEGKPDHLKQHLFLHAFVNANFNVSVACNMLGISVSVLNRWKRNPEFQGLLDEIVFHKKNFFESALMKLVSKGDSAAVLFANRTVNADRGYGSKVTVEHTGNVNHNVSVISIRELELSLGSQQEILQRIREIKPPEVLEIENE